MEVVTLLYFIAHYSPGCIQVFTDMAPVQTVVCPLPELKVCLLKMPEGKYKGSFFTEASKPSVGCCSDCIATVYTA